MNYLTNVNVKKEMDPRRQENVQFLMTEFHDIFHTDFKQRGTGYVLPSLFINILAAQIPSESNQTNSTFWI